MSLSLVLALPLALAPATLGHIGERPPALAELPAPAAPVDEPPELPRRTFELWPAAGLSLPQCGVSSGTGCAALSAGPELGLVGLMRPLPHFAFGASARRATFSAKPAEDTWRTSATMSLFSVVGRVYAFEGGRFDPYLELDLGAGSLGVEVTGHGAHKEEALFSPAVRSVLGVDVVLSGWLRAGAFLAYARYFPGTVSFCSDLGCGAVAASNSGLTLGSLSLGVEVGLVGGETL
ncbi:MAG TPA: hypothetical protein VFQ35_16310 [Polyangiaceae bacterium]|nr:hypothetical protein [Polyangiaceae bacterium]